MESTPIDQSSKYPSLELAYDYIIPLNDWVMRRLESAERRIDNLITFVITFTSAFGAGAIAISGFLENSQNTLQIIVALAVLASFVLNLGIGMRVRQMGSVPLFDLKDLYTNQITEQPEQFRKVALYSAGNNIAEIQSLVEKKICFANVMLLVFFIEIAFAASWVYLFATF